MPTLILVFLRILKRDCVRFLACYVRHANEVGRAASRSECGGMASGDEYCDTKLLTFKDKFRLCVQSYTDTAWLKQNWKPVAQPS